MASLLDDNKVTMSLGDFLVFRDAFTEMENLKKYAEKSRKTYGDRNERDVYDIGRCVLGMFDLPEELDGKEEEDA